MNEVIVTNLGPDAVTSIQAVVNTLGPYIVGNLIENLAGYIMFIAGCIAGLATVLGMRVWR